MRNIQKYLRGQVWWQRPTTDKVIKGIQNAGRPVIIISNNTGNRFSPVVTVVPLTTADKKELPTHVKVYMDDDVTISTVLCEQLRTISTELLDKYIGTIDETKMTEINAAILTALGFKQPEIQKTKQEPITIPEYKQTQITLDAEPEKETTNNSEKQEFIPAHNRAKKFSKREKEMILRYLGAHTIADTAKYFAPIYNIDYKKMYTRVCNIKNRNKR